MAVAGEDEEPPRQLPQRAKWAHKDPAPVTQAECSPVEKGKEAPRGQT